MGVDDVNNMFLRSALSEENPYISTDEVFLWVEERKKKVNVDIEPIPFNKLTEWTFDEKSEILRHNTGRYFSIDGIGITTNVGEVKQWEQPIINQSDIGVLGIITKKINGILYFLLQAKVEPGNINEVQLAPTLQATESNYTRVHKGIKPLFIDYFLKPKRGTVLLNQLQSEQGARFLKKKNRNMLVLTNDDIKGYEDFIWLSLGQIKKLMKTDNLINMDTRTVISGIPFGKYRSEQLALFDTFNLKTSRNEFNYALLQSSLNYDAALFSIDEIITWFTTLKSYYSLSLKKVSIFKVKDWNIGEYEIYHNKNKYFKVKAANINISSREVKSWQQPLIEPVDDGIIAFVSKKIKGVLHFLVQAKMECGTYDILEMAPTVQCITDSYDESEELPFLKYVLNVPKEKIKYDTYQSEEGGRFYHEQNRNIIIEADDDFPEEVPENYKWLTLNQLNMFLKFNNYLNIQSRSLISAIDFV